MREPFLKPGSTQDQCCATERSPEILSGTLGSIYNPNQNNFNFLRLLFASLVVFSHSYALLLGPGHSDPVASWLLNSQMDLGGIAVEGFFAISGFLVTQSWLNSKGVGSYCLKRILRVVPGYCASFVFCLAVILPLIGASPLAYLRGYSASAWIDVFTLGIAHGTPFIRVVLNGVLWTIPYEMRCYLVIAVLGVLGDLKQEARRVPPLLFLGTFLWYNHLHIIELANPNLSISAPARIVTFFFAGATAYLFRKSIPINRPALITALLATAFACHAGLSWILPFSGTYLLFYLGTHSKLQFPPFRKPMDLSYGIYLYGFPIQQVLIYHFRAHLTPMLLFSCALSLASLLGFFSWKFIESPALRLKRFASAL